MTTNVQQISDAEYAAALAAGRIEAETEIRAQAVRYVPERDAIEIVTSRNAGFLIPRQWIGALQDVPTEELSKLEVWPDGSAIELDDRDIQISVHGLLTAILPAMLPSRSVAAIFASRGAARPVHARSAKAREPTVVRVVDLEKNHPLKWSDFGTQRHCRERTKCPCTSPTSLSDEFAALLMTRWSPHREGGG